MQEKILQAIDSQRLLDTAVALVEVPSPTLSAGAVADRLGEILAAEGFAVERPETDWPEAPAVVARFDSGQPGRVLQFDGHLDTVHLPFVAPRIEDGVLYGSGSSDMKGGIAAFVEALRALRDSGALEKGGVLITAHDHHEAPWGDRRQLYAMIREGYVGDGVMLPEYLGDALPVGGRGMAVFSIEIERDGVPVHEVLRPEGLPDVVAVGAELVLRLKALGEKLREKTAPHIGSDTTFVGRVESGEIYNQSPTEFSLAGTRRWLPGTNVDDVRQQFDDLLAEVSDQFGVTPEATFHFVRDGYRLDKGHPVVAAFQDSAKQVMGAELPESFKPFVDDGNTFASIAGIPAITHGPDAHGAHTTQENVAVDELTRVALVYALTAVGFCCDRT